MIDFSGLKRFLRIPARDADRQAGDDVETEVRFHLESRTDELVAAGVPESEARRRAEREFGDVDEGVRALRRLARRTERERRRGAWWGGLRHDVVLAGRRLRSAPLFAGAAVLTLALGIGATTAIFSTVHAVLLRPLPFPEPERLVKVWEVNPQGEGDNVVSSGNYMDWRAQASSFEELGAHSWLFGATMTGEGDPVRLGASMITPAALRALGVEAEVGRIFTEEEGGGGAPRVALLGHDLWQTRFGGDPSVTGRTVRIEGESVTLVGVLPPSFDYPSPTVDVWLNLPFDAEDYQSRESHQWNVVGRLADGVSVERARAEMRTIAARLRQAHPENMGGWGVSVRPLREDLVGEDVRSLLVVLMGVVGVVLLLTCVNLANLFLTRATGREREIAVRGALGAGRWRLVRQLLVESLLLGAVGGGLALAVIVVGLDALVALAPGDIPLLDDVRVDGVVVAFAAGTTLLATLLFGLLPALRATDTSPQVSLRAPRDSGGVAHRRLRSALLLAEVALAVVLVVGAGLLTRSMVRLFEVDPGIDTERLLAATVGIPQSVYGSHEEQVAFFGTLVERIEEIPGVLAAAGTSDPPVLGYAMTFSYSIEGRPNDSPNGREDDERLTAVSPGYFEAVGTPIVRGRPIEARDGPDDPAVAVISESLARKQWPDGGAIGSRIRFREGQPWFEIVGVAADVRMDGLDGDTPPILYIPYAQKPWEWLTWQTLTVRTAGEPESVVPAIRERILSLDPNVVPERVTTFEEIYAGGAARRRFAAILLGAFAGLALLLGALGIYGLLAYSVTQRRREIGIRMALGAAPGRVAAGIVRGALQVVLAGVALGGAAAFALSRSLDPLLFRVEPSDPATYLAASAVLLVVAAGAAWLPARSATRVDPSGAMRDV